METLREQRKQLQLVEAAGYSHRYADLIPMSPEFRRV